MNHTPYVVVFPTVFTANKIPKLVNNIKKILNARGQKFKSVKRDGDVIIIKADDPVFASSAVNLLFGIEKIAIAQQVDNNFEKIVSEIAKTGGNLLVEGEKFLISVDGFSKGFLAKDVEIAATSELVERKTSAKPGTEHNYNRLLYCHLTRNNAYICIFTDNGMGGIPFRSTETDAVCCIYDELSGVACYEMMRQGFNPKIIICYKKKQELITLAKIINQLFPRLLRNKVDIEVYADTSRTDYMAQAKLALELSISVAESSGILHISVPITPLMFPREFVDYMINRTFECKKMPVMALAGLDSGIFADAVELGLEKRIPNISRLLSRRPNDTTAKSEYNIEQILESRQKINITIGPNNVHDFLDSLQNH